MNSGVQISIVSAFVLIIAPCLCHYSFNSEDLDNSFLEKRFTEDSNGIANFSSSGESGIAISGEPAHVGDILLATVIVSNSGNSTGTVSLNLENLNGSEIFQGDAIDILPGSTREVSALFSSVLIGQNSFRWWVSSFDGAYNETLHGQFILEISPPQILIAEITSLDWEDPTSLRMSATVFLSQGSHRDLEIKVSVGYSGSFTLLQTILVSADPGRRSIDFSLGSPQSDSVQVEVIPIGWTPSINSENTSIVSVDMPILEPSDLIVNCVFKPTSPASGSNVIATVTLENEGIFQSEAGKVRIILSSDKSILAESNVQSINSGATISTDLSILSWPDEDVVGLEIQWSTGNVVSASYRSVDSAITEEAINFPFDIVSAGLGALGGVVVILVGTIVWRGVSTRTPKTSKMSLRETKERSETIARKEKLEISCIFCEQRLKVPVEHKGGVRCPSCSMEFAVGDEKQSEHPIDEKQSDHPIVQSNEDNLHCPECEQTLRVPLERRPVVSRCPVCKTEFLAEGPEG